MLEEALNTSPSMYEVFSIDLEALEAYLQAHPDTAIFSMNIRTGWNWSLRLNEDERWAATMFEKSMFEGVTNNTDTNRVSLLITKTNLFGYFIDGNYKFHISPVSDLLGSGHAQHFIIHSEAFSPPPIVSDIMINLELGIEADYDLYKKFELQGFADPAGEVSMRILSKMMYLQGFYDNFFPNLRFYFRGPYVRDFYYNGDYPNVSGVLGQIRVAWKTRYRCIPVDAVMLFSGTDLDNNGQATYEDATSGFYNPMFTPVCYVDVSLGLSQVSSNTDRHLKTAIHELAHIMAFMGHVDNNQGCASSAATCGTSYPNVLCEAGTSTENINQWSLGSCVETRMGGKFIDLKDEYLTEVRPVPSLPCEASVSCIELDIETNNPAPFKPSTNCGDRSEITYTITVCNPCQEQEIQVAFLEAMPAIDVREEIVEMDPQLTYQTTIAGSTKRHKSAFFTLATNECKQYTVKTRLTNDAVSGTEYSTAAEVFIPSSPNAVKNALTMFTVYGDALIASGGTDANPRLFSSLNGVAQGTHALPGACVNQAINSYSFSGVTEMNLDHPNFTYTSSGNNFHNEYCFKNDLIRINENAKIIVKNGTLNISNSRIVGCSSLWNSIIVEDGATLVIENTIIEDGEYAIQAKPGARLEIRNCTFRDNYVAFYVANSGSGLPQQIDLLQFHGNVIETQGGLLSPQSGQKAYAGILIYNAASIVVGNENESQNIFRNLKNGILSFNSNLGISNTVFKDIRLNGIESDFIHPTDFPYSSYAVYASADPALVRIINVQGTYGSLTFEKCQTGIGIHGMRAIVENCNMQKVGAGIYINKARYRYFKFRYNNIQAQYYGIGLFQNTPTNVNVENNIITIDDSGNQGFGILVAENALSLPSHAFNRIANNTINLYKGQAGIKASSGRYTEFYNNTVNLQYDDKQTAMQIEGMADVLVRCNTVTSMAGTTLNARGIVAKGAYSSTFSCNHLYDTKIGMSFDGMGDQSLVRGNEFSGQAVGLQLEMNGHLGAQSHQGNRWFGSFGEFGAKHLGTSALAVEQSEFKVDATALSGQPGTYLPIWDALGAWFVPEVIADEYIFKCVTSNGCATTSPPVNIKDGMGELEAQLARGSFSSPQFTTEITWTGRRHLYSRIAENNIPLQNHAYVNSFYTNAANSSIEQLHEAGQSIKDALTLSATDESALESYSSDIESLLASLHQNTEALSTATSGISALLADRALILSDLGEMTEDADILSGDLYDDLISSVGAAKTVNSSISATAVYELNEKDYNNLFITAIEEDTFTTTQKAALWSIANQCPLEGGDGVYHARSLYASVDPLAVYNDVTLCSGQQSFSVPALPVSVSTAFELYPNPANDFIILRPLGLDEEAQILAILYDPLGRELLRTTSTGNAELVVDTRFIASGIVWIKLLANGIPIGTRVVAITK